MAESWRTNVKHRFLLNRPDNFTAQCFLLRLIRLGASGKRFVVRDSRDVHITLSSEQYEEHVEWFRRNFELIVGTESGILLKFISGQFEQFSPDRWYSSKACDEIGQEWNCDCYGYNRLMNNMEPMERIEFINKLVQHYKPKLADAVIYCYVFGLGDAKANKYLKPFGLKRKTEFRDSDVPLWRTVYRNQSNSHRHGFSRRKWTTEQMKEEWRLLCCLCLVTGISGHTLPINWDRIWDKEGLYQPGDVISTLVRVNDAARAHPAFFSKESFRLHLHNNGSSPDTHPFIAAVGIMRQFIEKLIATQISRQ